MKSFFYFVLITFRFTNSSFDDVNNSEIEVLTALFNNLKIRHCFLIGKYSDYVNFLSFKNFAQRYNMFLAYVEADGFKDFFQNTTKIFIKTGIVVKTNDVGFLAGMFESDPVKVAQFQWAIVTSEIIPINFLIPYDCEFFIISKTLRSTYEITEIYNIKNFGPYSIIFGKWSSKTNYIMSKLGLYQRRKDMKGATLIRTDNNGVAVCNNYTIENKHREVWEDYSRILNYSQLVVEDKVMNDPKAGLMAPDGSSCAVGYHSFNALPYVVHPTCETEAFMIIKYESDFDGSWSAYFRPFDDYLWYSILAWLIVSSVFYFIISFLPRFDIEVGIFTSLYTLCDQDAFRKEKPTSIGIRIAYLSTLIISNIIILAYEGAILSILAVQLPKVPFYDLEGFVKNRKYKMGTLNNTFLIFYFQRNKNPLEDTIYKKMFLDKSEYPNVDAEAVNILCSKKKFVFLGYTYDFVEKTSQCKLYKISTPLVKFLCGFKLKLNSPFYALFRKLLAVYYERGMMRRDPAVRRSHKFAEEEDDPLTLSQVAILFSLLPLGLVMSLFFIALERKVHRRKKGRIGCEEQKKWRLSEGNRRVGNPPKLWAYNVKETVNSSGSSRPQISRW